MITEVYLTVKFSAESTSSDAAEAQAFLQALQNDIAALIREKGQAVHDRTITIVGEAETLPTPDDDPKLQGQLARIEVKCETLHPGTTALSPVEIETAQDTLRRFNAIPPDQPQKFFNHDRSSFPPLDPK